jgi:hypothetical protein
MKRWKVHFLIYTGMERKKPEKPRNPRLVIQMDERDFGSKMSGKADDLLLGVMEMEGVRWPADCGGSFLGQNLTRVRRRTASPRTTFFSGVAT